MTITPYDFIIDDLGMCISILFLIFLSNEVSLYVPNFIVYCWNSWDLKFIPFFFFLYFYIRFRNLFEEQGGGVIFYLSNVLKISKPQILEQEYLVTQQIRT